MISSAKPFTKGFIIVAVLFIIAMVVYVLGSSTASENTNENNSVLAEPEFISIDPPTDEDHMLSSPDAFVTIVEYADLECAFCEKYHATLQQIVDAHGGQVSWVYRHFPLADHKNAFKEAEAAECANELGGNTAFWQYIDQIYLRTESNGEGFAIEQLVPLAVEIGLSETDFSECLESGRHAERVERDIESGARAGVTSTPTTFVISGDGLEYKLIGNMTFEDLFGAIQSLYTAPTPYDER